MFLRKPVFWHGQFICSTYLRTRCKDNTLNVFIWDSKQLAICWLKYIFYKILSLFDCQTEPSSTYTYHFMSSVMWHREMKFRLVVYLTCSIFTVEGFSKTLILKGKFGSRVKPIYCFISRVTRRRKIKFRTAVSLICSIFTKKGFSKSLILHYPSN